MFKIIASSKTAESKFGFFKIYINIFTVLNTKFNEDIVPSIVPLCRSRLHRERGRGTGERVGGPLRRQLLGNRLLSGGDSGVFSPVRPLLASQATAAGLTWVPRMHRAERAAPLVGEKRKV